MARARLRTDPRGRLTITPMKTITTIIGAALLLAWLAYFYAASAVRAVLGMSPTEAQGDEA